MMAEYRVKYKGSMRKHLPAAGYKHFSQILYFKLFITAILKIFCLPDASSYLQFSPFYLKTMCRNNSLDQPLGPDLSSRRVRRTCDSWATGCMWCARSHAALERITHFHARRAFPAQEGDSRGRRGQTEVLLHQRAAGSCRLRVPQGAWPTTRRTPTACRASGRSTCTRCWWSET